MKRTLICFMAAACFILNSAQPLHAQANNEQLLFSIGSTSAMLAYNTYLAIGSNADSYTLGCMEAQLVKDLMAEQDEALAGIAEDYQKLIDSGELTDSDDKEYLSEMIDLLNVLRAQAKALSKYVDTNADIDADEFQVQRQKAWDMISNVLGIE